MQQPCQVQKISFHSTTPYSPGPPSFLLSLPKYSLSSNGDVWYICPILALEPNSLSFSTFWPVLSTCISYCPLQKKLFSTRLRLALTYRYKHKYSKGTLATCLFSQTAVVGVPQLHKASQVKGFDQVYNTRHESLPVQQVLNKIRKKLVAPASAMPLLYQWLYNVWQVSKYCWIRVHC